MKLSGHLSYKDCWKASRTNFEPWMIWLNLITNGLISQSFGDLWGTKKCCLNRIYHQKWWIFSKKKLNFQYLLISMQFKILTPEMIEIWIFKSFYLFVTKFSQFSDGSKLLLLIFKQFLYERCPENFIFASPVALA